MALYSRGSLVVFSLFSSLSFGKEGKGKVVKHRLLKLNLLCLTRQHFRLSLMAGFNIYRGCTPAICSATSSITSLVTEKVRETA